MAYMRKEPKVMNGKKKVLIVDDHPIVCMGLTCLFNQEDDLLVCGEAHNTHEALEAIEELQPDVAIIDISLKGQSGIELIKNIKSHYPKFPILVLSIHDESIYAELVLRVGAMGYIMKQEASEKIVLAVRQVLKGDLYVSHDMTSHMLHKYLNGRSAISGSPMELLSDRELEVLRLMGQGFGTRQIANELIVGVKTIETYRAHLKKKLNIKNSTELVKYAIQWVQSEFIT
jgi:DNA-binding NarL/FixJ family response regulator